MMMRPAAFLSSTSSNDHRTNSHLRLAGTYVDLGSIIGNAAAASSAPPLVTSQDDVAPASTTANADNNNSSNNRSDRWIVLIDDEPSIRLAVGDYLHTVAGFDTVTAVDGPMAFLDACLWGCSWSLASPPAATTASTGGDGDDEPSPPPWTATAAAGGYGREEGSTTRRRSWRLPDCVISDVRMPGGIDGIKLLQLMRDRPPPSTTTPTTTTTTIADDESKQSPPGRRKRGRPKATTDVSYNYDGKDEYDLMATIIDGTEGRSSRIVTPADQAIQYMDAIHSCISYFLSSDETNGSSNVINNGLLPRQVGKNDDDGPTSLGDIPVILLTAKAMISDRIMGYGAGANGYLPKPFRPEELLGMVDNLIRRQRENRQQQQQQRQQQRQQQQQQQQQYESNNYGGSNYQGRDILDGYLTPEQAREITNELIDIKKSIISSRTGSSSSSSSSSSSIGGVSRIGTTFARGTEEEVVFMYQHLQSLLPRALWMYRTGERRKRIFTRDHIYSILVLCYNMDIITSLTTIKKKNVGWDVLFKELDDRYLECPEQCELVI